MDITTADIFLSQRGYADWAALALAARQAALLNAQDYIAAHYNIHTTLTTEQQQRLDTAQALLAREIAIRPLGLRSTASVKRQREELGDLKTETEYQEAQQDPYPMISALLLPLRPLSNSTGFSVGRLVRQ